MSEAVATMDNNLAQLEQLAAESNEQAQQTAEELVAAEQEAYAFKPLDIELLSGWEFCEWKQRHLMALADSGILDNDRQWDNEFRMNYEVVAAAIEAECFYLPTNIEPDQLLDMDWRDVQKLRQAVMNNYLNLRLTPKN